MVKFLEYDETEDISADLDNDLKIINEDLPPKGEDLKQSPFIKQPARVKKPAFKPAIISHLGELSRDMSSTVEWMTGAARSKARNSFKCTVKEAVKLTSEFRNQLKDSLITIMAAGFGRSLTLSGYKRLDKGRDYL